uniref:Tick transposon n=1 Tax=Rhipicephalus appendiculatus TaxID=34631 RepID=A0A131YG51_RHIAP
MSPFLKHSSSLFFPLKLWIARTSLGATSEVMSTGAVHDAHDEFSPLLARNERFQETRALRFTRQVRNAFWHVVVASDVGQESDISSFAVETPHTPRNLQRAAITAITDSR